LAIIKESSKQNFERIDKIATLLDSKFQIPGTKIKIGIDGIIGFLPVIGDLSGFVISLVLIVAIVREGASGKVVAKMLGNLLLDVTIGEIPFLGNIFNIFYKSNKRNVALAKAHFVEGKHKGQPYALIFGIIVFFTLFFWFSIWIIIKLIKAILAIV
jgi:hypothetical protein